jgi:hypothetical protein
LHDDEYREHAELDDERFIERTYHRIERTPKRVIVDYLDVSEEPREGLVQGDTFIVADQDVAWDTPVTSVIRHLSTTIQQVPSMRGGSGGDSEWEPVHSKFDEHCKLAEKFDDVFNRLMQNTVKSCGQSPPSACTQAWMEIASIFQMRNRYLEHQVTDARELNTSLVEDVQWHMRALAELEERVEVMQEEKAAALTELGLLEKSFERVGEACWGPPYSPLHKIRTQV